MRTATWTSSRRGSWRPPDARLRLIATDGVFSMDGYLATLDEICDLADRHDALVIVDDSHAVGFVGPKRTRDAASTAASSSRVDILTGTLGKALGGASGGYVAGRRGDRRAAARSAPGRTSSRTASPRPSSARASGRSTCIERSDDLRDRLWANTAQLPRADDRARLRPAPRRPPDRAGDDRRRVGGRTLLAGARRARRLRRGFSYPVVPRGTARIRTQMSAAHTDDDLDLAVRAFVAARDATS